MIASRVGERQAAKRGSMPAKSLGHFGLKSLALTVCVLLCACGENDSAQKANGAEELIKSETALMADPERAGPELERRLTDSVRADGGLLLVHSRGGILYVLPATTPWTLDCFFAGMSIEFGNSITGDNSDTSNDVIVNLTTGQIDQRNCDILGPRIGKRLLAMIEQAEKR
jgi:hypothetical protein